jgi:hypothetical protein
VHRDRTALLRRVARQAVYIEYIHARPRSEKLLNALAKALNFSAPELMENRRGVLHGNQLSRLAGEHIVMPMLGVLLSILTPLLFRYVWAAAVEDRSLLRFTASLLSHPSSFLNQMRFGIEEPFPLVIEFGYLIFPLVLIHYLFRIPWKIFFDLYRRKITMDSGHVSVRWDEKRLSRKDGREGDLISRYSYFVNGHEYRVSRAAYEALVPQLDYVLYYLPKSRVIVSAEPTDLTPFKIQPGMAGLQVVRLHHDPTGPKVEAVAGDPAPNPSRYFKPGMGARFHVR